jgi:hypothetical protein
MSPFSLLIKSIQQLFLGQLPFENSPTRSLEVIPLYTKKNKVIPMEVCRKGRSHD